VPAGTQQPGLTRSAIWLRLDLANTSPSPRSLRLVLGPHGFLHQSAYMEDGDHWTSLDAGSAATPLQVSRQPSARFVLQPHSHARIFVRMQSPALMQINPTLYTDYAYQQSESHSILWSGLFFGGLLAFGWGALIIALLARNLSFSLLGIECLLVLLHEASQQGYAKIHLWPQNPAWDLISSFFFGHIAFTVLILFALHVAKAERLILPKRPLLAMACMEMLLAFGVFFVDLYILNKIAVYTLPLTAATIMVGAIYLIRQKAPSRKLILLQTVFTFLVFVLHALESLAHPHFFHITESIDPVVCSSVLSLAGLLINLAIVAVWIHHIARQRRVATDKLLAWQEQEQQKLQEEVARQTAALHQAVEYADQRNRQKTEILGYIGHDLRTPLATISGYVKLLKGSNRAYDASYVLAIERSINYQMTLIDELLNYAKTELHPPTLSPAPVYTRTLLDDIAYHAQGLALLNNNQVQFNISCALPELILLDGRRLQQVLFNLLGNAAKFTKDGFICLDIQAAQTGVDWHVRFAVIDSGVGIAADEQATVFKPFQQLHPQDEGMGLGLFISRNIVRGMGSDLHLYSTPEHGSIFSFHLNIRSLNDKIVVWNPPDPLPSREHAAVQEQGEQTSARSTPSPELPEQDRMALALMARSGHITDIENWLEKMSGLYPSYANLFDKIKAALYALDLEKVESLAFEQD